MEMEVFWRSPSASTQKNKLGEWDVRTVSEGSGGTLSSKMRDCDWSTYISYHQTFV